MCETTPKYNVKKILELQSIAPMYLVQDEKTSLYGVQTHFGNFKIEPKYKLDENYDLSKKYVFAEVDKNGCIFLIEA